MAFLPIMLDAPHFGTAPTPPEDTKPEATIESYYGSPRIYIKKNLAQRYEKMSKSEKKASAKKLNLALTDRASKLSSRFNNSFHNYRFIVVLMGGASYGLMLLFRYNINVAMLNMVNRTAVQLDLYGENGTFELYLPDVGSTDIGEFNWNNEIQHMIMSWYMISYTLSQIFTTKVGTIIGVRRAIPISILICSVSNLLIPVVAYGGWEYVIILRLMNGIGASAVVPLMLDLIETWMPDSQRFFGLTCAQLVSMMISASTFWVTGYLCNIYWSYAFYVTGTVGAIFSLICYILIADKPSQSWLISEKELQTINAGDRDNQAEGGKDSIEPQEKQTAQSKATWVEVLFVPSFYIFNVFWCFQQISDALFNFISPTYLSQFLKIEVNENGRYCSIIQLGCIVAVLWPHQILKSLKDILKLSDTAANRTVIAIVGLGCTCTWTYVGLFHRNQLVALLINRCFQHATEVVFIETVMSCFSHSGLSSIIFSIINAIGCLAIVLASTATGYFLDVTGSSIASWSQIFYGLCVCQIILVATYCLFIRSEPIELRSQVQARIRLDLEQGRKPVSIKTELKCSRVTVA